MAKLAIKVANKPSMTEVISIKEFLNRNYGNSSPELNGIFSPQEIVMSGDLEPQILGCKLGKISFSRKSGDTPLGTELNSLTDKINAHIEKICKAASVESLYLHFDELDRGLTSLTESRKEMITGLILAAKEVRLANNKRDTKIQSIIYLREDIWNELMFSDKNKISESNADLIEWNHEQLFGLISKRLKNKLGEDAEWDFVDDGKKINRQPKWRHIIDRSLMRPRDIISFLNILLDTTKKHSKNKFENKDVVESRPKYSNYFKKELDDEILTHWSDWDVCLKVISKIGKLYFSRVEYQAAYDELTTSGQKTYTAADSLEQLYNFSVLEYDSRSGYGGSAWKSKFANPELGWDPSASRFKVHLGLKEFLKLKEERK